MPPILSFGRSRPDSCRVGLQRKQIDVEKVGKEIAEELSAKPETAQLAKYFQQQDNNMAASKRPRKVRDCVHVSLQPALLTSWSRWLSVRSRNPRAHLQVTRTLAKFLSARRVDSRRLRTGSKK
jgi:hypothetical protein